MSNQQSDKTIGSERFREEKPKEEIKNPVLLPKTSSTIPPLKGIFKNNF